MIEAKPFNITQQEVLIAYKQVKANKGTGGIDGIDLVQFEENLNGNLYKIWNRMASGSYFPKAVRGVEILKKNGKKRLLGIPTIEDRVAQMVVRNRFEPKVEPVFMTDSYGYRPNKSALDAIKATRERCWQYEWVLELDIVGLFDNIDHELLLKAIKAHTADKMEILYITRFLKADIVMPDGNIRERIAGTPQGGVISPVLANLFMHYAFDKWMNYNFPQIKWARYADDAVIHCVSEKQALYIKQRLERQLCLCKLQLQPEKTRIVHCTCDKFPQKSNLNEFTFLGYTFRTRWVKNKQGILFRSFTPAVSKEASKAFCMKIKECRLRKGIGSLAELAENINPIIRGWMNYFMEFGKGEAIKSLDYINLSLLNFIQRFYGKRGKNKHSAWRFLAIICKREPKLFYHWTYGITVKA